MPDNFKKRKGEKTLLSARMIIHQGSKSKLLIIHQVFKVEALDQAGETSQVKHSTVTVILINLHKTNARANSVFNKDSARQNTKFF